MRLPKSALFALKALVSVGLVSWIVSSADLRQIKGALAAADVRLLALAFALYFVGYFVVASRWRILLRVHGVDPPLSRLVESFAVSVFFNNILPSTIGGDVSRAFDSWRFGSSRAVALIVVLVDRFIGLCAMLLLTGAAFLAAPRVVAHIPLLPQAMLLIVCFAVAASLVLFGVPRGPIRRLAERAQRLPGIVGRVARKILQGVAAYWGKNHALVSALMFSLVLQLVVILHFVLIARALDIAIPLTAMFVVIPAVLMVMMMPFTINGIGVREAAFVYFFSFYGIPSEKALALAWVQFGFVLLQGLLGGLVFLVRRRTGSSAPPPDAPDKVR